MLSKQQVVVMSLAAAPTPQERASEAKPLSVFPSCKSLVSLSRYAFQGDGNRCQLTRSGFIFPFRRGGDRGIS